MSILIKGMEKPEECYCCPCSTINMNGRWGKCNLLGRDYAGDPHKIYDDCPLVEIPPHGRLIDADYTKKHLTFSRGINDCGVLYAPYGEIKKEIDRMPIVIESEEQEHE